MGAVMVVGLAFALSACGDGDGGGEQGLAEMRTSMTDADFECGEIDDRPDGEGAVARFSCTGLIDADGSDQSITFTEYVDAAAVPDWGQDAAGCERSFNDPYTVVSDTITVESEALMDLGFEYETVASTYARAFEAIDFDGDLTCMPGV